MTESTLDLDRLEALAKAATPGPWTAHHTISKSTISALRLAVEDFVVVSNGEDGDEARCDAAFIAAANPTVVLALLQELRAHRAYRAKLCPHGYRYHPECPECSE